METSGSLNQIVERSITMEEQKEVKGIFTFDQDSKRFHRFRIEGNGGIVGNLYVPKDCEGTPEKIVLNYQKKSTNTAQD